MMDACKKKIAQETAEETPADTNLILIGVNMLIAHFHPCERHLH